MNGITWKLTILVLLASLTLLGRVEAQQPQQHHPGSTQTLQEQEPQEEPESPTPMPMMQQMQGMMQQMQGMMQQMHGRMQQRHGKMGRGMMRRGMMMGAEDEMGQGMMIQRRLERLTQQLELTEDQKMQVQALLSTEAKEVIRLQADIDTTTIDLHQLLDTETVDIARVKTALQTIAMKEADLHLAHITKIQELRKLLTPEQQQKFRMSWAHMMGHGEMMGEEGMRMHGKRMKRNMQGQGQMTNPCGRQRDKPKN